MPRLNPLDPAAATGPAKDLLDGVKAKLGFVPNLMRTMANEPAVLAAYLGFSEALGKGSFDQKTREAIALAVAGANTCDYCASAHVAISKGLKIDEAEIRARLAGKSADPKVAAALAFTRAVVEKRGEVSDEDVAAVRASGFGDGEIALIVAYVALNTLTNYLNHVARTEIDFPVVNSALHRAA